MIVPDRSRVLDLVDGQSPWVKVSSGVWRGVLLTRAVSKPCEGVDAWDVRFGANSWKAMMFV